MPASPALLMTSGSVPAGRSCACHALNASSGIVLALSGAPFTRHALSDIKREQDRDRRLTDRLARQGEVTRVHDTDTVVDRLNAKIQAGAAKLVYDEKTGYIKSVLQLLDIPVEVLEAAAVDGAVPRQIVQYVVVPMLRPVTHGASSMAPNGPSWIRYGSQTGLSRSRAFGGTTRETTRGSGWLWIFHTPRTSPGSTSVPSAPRQ